jgi:hypothetical protein
MAAWSLSSPIQAHGSGVDPFETVATGSFAAANP